MIIGLFLRAIKTYRQMHFIPVAFNNQNKMINYIGDNGVGKSSILEGLDSFFNKKEYNVNIDYRTEHREERIPFFVPIFLIEKEKISNKLKETLERLSNYFWSVDEKEINKIKASVAKDFSTLRNVYMSYKDTHYLLILGENINNKLHFGFFEALKEEFYNPIIDENILDEIKNLYSYIYLPVEANAEEFTKLETVYMQKITGKNIREEIEKKCLPNIDYLNNLLEKFIDEISDNMSGEYKYKPIKQKRNKIEKNDLISLIIENYFKKRTLFKSGVKDKKISELSAGEKRQALIKLIYAFLYENKREQTIILGVDEPENSLHTTKCYEQFEILNNIAKSDNIQVITTTHWYGFMPIISNACAHILTKNDDEDEIIFDSYNLYDYNREIKQKKKNRKVSINYHLKSKNDLVQSIYYSCIGKDSYNWLLVEGISEKIYFEYFLKDVKNLKILPLGGIDEVIKIYNFLCVATQEKNDDFVGKIYCITDTDQNTHNNISPSNNNRVVLKRLLNKQNSNEQTEVVEFKYGIINATSIENALNPICFKETLNKMNFKYMDKINIEDPSGNTDFVYNLDCKDLHDFFKKNNGENKIPFAKNYVELMQENSRLEHIPSWINDIKNFFIGN